MLLITVCTVYFFEDAMASVKVDNKSPTRGPNLECAVDSNIPGTLFLPTLPLLEAKVSPLMRQ